MLTSNIEPNRDEISYFDFYPKVVQANKETEIIIKPRYGYYQFKSSLKYAVTYKPVHYTTESDNKKHENEFEVKAVNNQLQFRMFFSDEQEHVFIVREVKGKDIKILGKFKVYSLKNDLFRLKPYKGDLHMHSHCSDGKESPEYVAAYCRKAGFDFMALTDHYQYQPSIRAQQVYENVDIDLQIFPGEEIHPPEHTQETPLHIVNFGGKFSINEYIQNSTKKYFKQVMEIEEQVGELPAGIDSYQYAAALWVFNKIREADGLSILCHPYWVSRDRFDVSAKLTSQLFKEKSFDAVEIIAGYHRYEAESNNLMVTRYQEELYEGNRLPIVGVSDAHGCKGSQLFGWYYTIAFANSLSFNEITNSIREFKSVAVEAIPGEYIRVYGPFRLVKYTQFLLREVLPDYNKLCEREGELMLAFIDCNNKAKHELNELKGQTRELFEHLWG